jgi:hypothetical protein
VDGDRHRSAAHHRVRGWVRRSGLQPQTRFPSLEAMEQMVEMGMEEGLTMAVGQIDGLLAAG